MILMIPDCSTTKIRESPALAMETGLVNPEENGSRASWATISVCRIELRKSREQRILNDLAGSITTFY